MKRLITILSIILLSSCQKDCGDCIADGVWSSDDGKYQFTILNRGDLKPVNFVKKGNQMLFITPMSTEYFDIVEQSGNYLKLNTMNKELIVLKKR